MIPEILHQTWKTDDVPERFQPWMESWSRHNPGWTRMFWNDRTLLEFVARHYPDFLETFCSYPNGVMRADAGRYMLLHHFGGVYADIDCECVAQFDSIMGEDRVVLCLEPGRHIADHAPQRGLPYLLFNGTMASPAGHPFWRHLLSYLPTLAGSRNVLDATGPCVLTSAQMSFADRDSMVVHPSALFASLDSCGLADGEGAEGSPALSVHHWAGTWFEPERKRRSRAVKNVLYKTKYLLTRGEQAVEQELRDIDPACIDRPAPEGGNVALLVPLRDAVEHIAPFLDRICALDYPLDRIKLVFCEGDSRDGSWEKLQVSVSPLRDTFRAIELLQLDVGTKFRRPERSQAKLQRMRRAGLARVRNHLIEKGLHADDDWALWISMSGNFHRTF